MTHAIHRTSPKGQPFKGVCAKKLCKEALTLLETLQAPYIINDGVPVQVAPPVRVKPLVWERQPYKREEYLARVPYAHYRIRKDKESNIYGLELASLGLSQIGYFNTLREAKSAAEAHYAAKIAECLEMVEPVDLEGLKREPVFYPEFSEYRKGLARGEANGWNDCIDHLAAKGMLNIKKENDDG